MEEGEFEGEGGAPPPGWCPFLHEYHRELVLERPPNKKNILAPCHADLSVVFVFLELLFSQFTPLLPSSGTISICLKLSSPDHENSP